jgi:hypothetical protein
MADKYNHSSHWVSKVIDSEWPIAIQSPLLSSIVRFGTLPNVFFLFVVLLGPATVPSDFLVAIIFAILWLNIGPFLIWYYDERVMPTFFGELVELLEDEARIEQLSETYDRLFSRRYWIPTAAWTLLLVGLFFRSQPFLAERGLFEIGDSIYFAYLLSVVWLGLMTGIGFMGVITTSIAIREISDEPLSISPYHPDGLGGLGIFGYYAIRTTITFSTGSLLLPMAFIFVRASGVNMLIYAIVVAYTGAIALSFVYPTYKINRQAQRIRDETLEDLRRKYERAKKQMEDVGDVTNQLGESPNAAVRTSEAGGSDNPLPNVTELVGQLELQRIKREYEDYRNVRLYPFQIDILIKLVSSVLLPLAFVVIDHYLGVLVANV